MKSIIKQTRYDGSVLEIFDGVEFGEFRIIRDFDNGLIWFCLRDCCRILGIESSIDKPLPSGLDFNGVCSKYYYDSDGRKDMIFISKDNVAILMTKSNSPKIKIFRNWINEKIFSPLQENVDHETSFDDLTDPSQFVTNIGKAFIAIGEKLNNMQKIVNEHTQKFTKVEQDMATNKALLKVLCDTLLKNSEEDEDY